jgi:TorA maturation chaperone TorD
MTTVMTDTTSLIRRGDTYKLLAACFYEPEKRIFLEENLCENLAQLLQHSTPEGAKAAEDMLISLQKYDQQQLSIDHAALFVGPFELIAAPYSSVWREKQRLVMGDSTMDVKRFYDEADLQTDVSEPPDHVAIMLEFMSYLCQREAEAVSLSASEDAKKYADLQKRFYREALSPWIADFCNAITKGTDNSFYTNLATALSHYIKSEYGNYA